MTVFDPIYGRFEVPDYLSRLVVTPEVRRLSQIRLLNTLTPSLATLGDLRRYSHTLGVLFLCSQLRLKDFSTEELRALAASVLLHDIGTPPFGHLVEYHLKESTGWTHEGVIKAVLRGTYAPENRAAQIFAGRTLQFRSALKTSGIASELVEAIVTGGHPLSSLLFGTIDLDNLDNVARMGWALGMDEGRELATRLAGSLSVDRLSRLMLPIEEREYVHRWAAMRRRIYDILVFDPPTVAAQAVLSEAVEIAIQEAVLSENDWYLTDEQLLERLQAHWSTKDAVAASYLGYLPEMIFNIQVQGSLSNLDLQNRSQAKTSIENVLREELDDASVLGYVFLDKGTFEKSLSFLDPISELSWTEGITSASVVLYAFVRSHRLPSASRLKCAIARLLRDLNVPEQMVKRCRVAPHLDACDDQSSLAFTTD